MGVRLNPLEPPSPRGRAIGVLKVDPKEMLFVVK
jgi:hypothetical protein